MHSFIYVFEIEVIRLIRIVAWFHVRLWNCVDQIDQNTEIILNFVYNWSLWSSESGICLIMYGFQIRQFRLIMNVSHQVRLWIWTAQTHQTCAWFLGLWNWADQSNQREEFWNFVFLSLCSGKSDIHLFMFGSQVGQFRLIRNVFNLVWLWTLTAQTHQTCARFLILWNWADQTNQREEFLKLYFLNFMLRPLRHPCVHVWVSSWTVQADQECIQSSLALNFNCSDSSDMCMISCLTLKLSWSD